MKKFENLGRMLSKYEQKNVIGGLDDGDDACLTLGDPCNDDVQCCSNNCRTDNSTTTGKTCKNSTGG